MPSLFTTTPADYLGTLRELQGFIASQQCDVVLIDGDFDVHFAPGGSLYY